LSELVDNLGVPVVNHPTKAVQSIRDVSAKLLEGIPGILVPKTLRFSSVGKTREELVHEIEDHFDYPLITRTLAFQTGIGMNKADNRDALVKLMAEDFPDKFFVTQFVDSRHGDELFRKIRAAVVNDEIMIVRVDYDTDWKVHGRRKDYRVAFYLENMHLLGEEKRIIQDPEAGLGRPALQSLRAVRERIALDVFGIDFAVDADGLLVFYEANATMNLFSTARKEVPNPPEADDCLRQAFCRYFTSLIKRR
jgi:glutathione synthase/RimK-type ligase-like ATP-grasp enzyme